jgi:hypothetical protein
MAWHESLHGSSGHRRPPLTGLAFLQSEAAQARRAAVGRTRFQARDLFSLLLRHFAQRRPAPEPRCHVRLTVLTPAGLPAVRIVARKRISAPVETAPARQARS